MEIFLVGGAVRDKLLGREVYEKDWLVVGATYEQCIQQGWKPVAKGIPVFVHPETGEEYAMARIERKTGVGYRGFEFDYGPEISLEQDLRRRDLTINALVMDEQGNLIDPCGFAADLSSKTLRHISAEFSEDPVRVVRLSALYARLYKMGFTVDPSTIQLIRTMTSAQNAPDEFSSLSPPQLWTQLEKSLNSDAPAAFVEMLVSLGSGEMILPADLTSPTAIERLKSVSEKEPSPCVRLGAWIYPLDPESKQAFFARFEIPRLYRRFDEKLTIFYPFYVDVCNKPIPIILDMFKQIDAFGDTDDFSELVHCCHSILDCSPDHARIPQVQKEFLHTLRNCAICIDRSRIHRRNIEGTPKMAEEIDKHRCAEMARVRRYYPWSDLSVGKNRPEPPPAIESGKNA